MKNVVVFVADTFSANELAVIKSNDVIKIVNIS